MKFVSTYLCFFFFTLLAETVFSQNNSFVYHFDKDFNNCSKADARYLGLGKKENGKIKLTCYTNDTKERVFEGYFTDSSLATREGPFSFFDSKGFEEAKGYFVNNKKVGYWVRWGETDIADSTFYESDEEVLKIIFSYFKTGKLSTRELIDNKKNIKENTVWNEDGNIEIQGRWINGNGEQYTYHPNGKVGAIKTYKNNQVVSSRYFTDDGTELIVDESKKKEQKKDNATPQAITSPPTYPGGSAGFDSFFKRNFKPPASLGNQGFSESVTVTFYLDKSGFANNIRVTGASNRDIETEVMTVFRRMPRWNMNGYPAFGPITYTINL